MSFVHKISHFSVFLTSEHNCLHAQQYFPLTYSKIRKQKMDFVGLQLVVLHLNFDHIFLCTKLGKRSMAYLQLHFS